MSHVGYLIANVLPVWILSAALFFGPLPIVVRGLIRSTLGSHYVHRWYKSATVGLALGMVIAVSGAVVFDIGGTLQITLICLLFLSAVVDWQWRWLPIEWTLGVIALAIIHGIFSGDVAQTALQILVPSVILFVCRQLLFWILKKEALGLGDIWLLAGLGGFLPIYGTFLLVGLAAISGLVEVVIRRCISCDQRKTTGVSYGTHLCIVFLILQNFSQFM